MTPQEHADNFSREVAKNSEEAVNVMGNELFETLVNTKPNQLPEIYFRTYFLPLFCGEVSSENENIVISNWIGVAGSLSQPVDIVDPNGLILFQVPPFVDTTAIDKVSVSVSAVNFSRFMTDNMRVRSSLPRVADNDLHGELGIRASKVTAKEERIDVYRKKWSEIFKRYNVVIPGFSSESGKTIENTVSRGGIPDDEIEYD